MIPKIIHFVFLRKEEPFPQLFETCMERIKEMHPTWNIQLYDESMVFDILKANLPEFVDVYQSFKHNIQKADFIRIALLYIFGGFYMDLDMLILKPLDELNSHRLVLGEEKTICEEEQCHLKLKHRLRIANYMFGGIPKHPFWLLLMNEMAARATIPIKYEQEILDITGPGLVTDTFLDNQEIFPDIILLKNADRKCLNPHHNQAISCHFGDYAAHLHAGTWRDEVK